MSVAKKVIAIASAEVGYREGRNSNGSYNNNQKYSPAVPGLEWSQNQAWCQTFQSWVALKAGTASYEPRTASCRTATDWFKQRNRFSYYPAIGAQVFFGSGGGSHVGRVYKYDANTVWTIEGNTNASGSAEGNGVYLKQRARRDNYLHGYGLPAFPEGITTADPALKGKSGYHYKSTASAPVSSGSGGGSNPGTGVARYKVTLNGLQYGYGATGAHVTAVGQALVKAGCGEYQEGPGPNWSDADTKSYAKYQRKLGYSGADADGVPGESSLKTLMGKLPSASDYDKPKRKLVRQQVTGYMPELRYGDENWHVDFMQRMINRFISPKVKVTGKYDAQTAKGVHEFYAKALNYKTTTGGKVFSSGGWRRALSLAKGTDGKV